MRNSHLTILMISRWLLLLFVCLVIIFIGFIANIELTRWSYQICPQGWWRESPGKCAFPFVSIMKTGFIYGMVSMLLLVAVGLLAPIRKIVSCTILLAALMLWPIYILIFQKFSWVALTSFSSVIAIALCFALGVTITHNPAFKRDALKRAP